MCDDVDNDDDEDAPTSHNTTSNSGNGDDERYADYFESIRSETGLGEYIPRRLLDVIRETTG
jgi:hypothetical protein